MTKLSDSYSKEIKQFTDAMKYKLHANRHKGKWEGVDIPKLFDLLRKEVEELREEIEANPRNEVAILLEAADIGNYAMMIVNLAMREAVGGAVSPLTLGGSINCGEIPGAVTSVDDTSGYKGTTFYRPKYVGTPIGTGMFAGEVHSKPVHPFNLPFERNEDNV